MMQRRAVFTSLAALAALGACSPSKFKRYNGPPVTHVVVNKGARRMYLLNGQTVLTSHDIALGFAPVGDKQIEGDGKTPEGTYLIDRRNPDSEYHLSLGISYPNAEDLAQAAALGKEPGGDIFIHGHRNPLKRNRAGDWTWGCIAVTNDEMENIYAMVLNGTPITINP